MIGDAKWPRRKNLRLKDYDYSNPDFYFITICCQNKAYLFGGIVDGEMLLNDAGKMIEKWYLKIEEKFPKVKCHEKVTMPNHFHCIIELLESPPQDADKHAYSPLHVIVQWFKTMSTNDYIYGVKHLGWPLFPGRLWQRNYYEHIIRNQTDFKHIHDYILNNPLRWEDDSLK